MWLRSWLPFAAHIVDVVRPALLACLFAWLDVAPTAPLQAACACLALRREVLRAKLAAPAEGDNTEQLAKGEWVGGCMCRLASTCLPSSPVEGGL